MKVIIPDEGVLCLRNVVTQFLSVFPGGTKGRVRLTCTDQGVATLFAKWIDGAFSASFYLEASSGFSLECASSAWKFILRADVLSLVITPNEVRVQTSQGEAIVEVGHTSKMTYLPPQPQQFFDVPIKSVAPLIPLLPFLGTHRYRQLHYIWCDGTHAWATDGLLLAGLPFAAPRNTVYLGDTVHALRKLPALRLFESREQSPGGVNVATWVLTKEADFAFQEETKSIEDRFSGIFDRKETYTAKTSVRYLLSFLHDIKFAKRTYARLVMVCAADTLSWYFAADSGGCIPVEGVSCDELMDEVRFDPAFVPRIYAFFKSAEFDPTQEARLSFVPFRNGYILRIVVGDALHTVYWLSFAEA